MKYRFMPALIACAALSGCQKTPDEPAFVCKYDQDIRREVFMECLRVVPQGPVSTKYNDWSEVVEECGSQAGYLSLRGCKDTRSKESQQTRVKP